MTQSEAVTSCRTYEAKETRLRHLLAHGELHAHTPLCQRFLQVAPQCSHEPAKNAHDDEDKNVDDVPQRLICVCEGAEINERDCTDPSPPAIHVHPM